jgi:hypothetical protein
MDDNDEPDKTKFSEHMTLRQAREMLLRQRRLALVRLTEDKDKDRAPQLH